MTRKVTYAEEEAGGGGGGVGGLGGEKEEWVGEVKPVHNKDVAQASEVVLYLSPDDYRQQANGPVGHCNQTIYMYTI